MSDEKTPDESNESDSKGATEDETQKISAIDPADPLGNERPSEEHSGQEGKREER